MKKFRILTILVTATSFVSNAQTVDNNGFKVSQSLFGGDQGGAIELRAATNNATPYIDFARPSEDYTLRLRNASDWNTLMLLKGSNNPNGGNFSAEGNIYAANFIAGRNDNKWLFRAKDATDAFTLVTRNVQDNGWNWDKHFTFGKNGNLIVRGNGRFEYGVHSVRSMRIESPDDQIHGLSLIRKDEDNLHHEWKWWHMNEQYGKNSLQLWEYKSSTPNGVCANTEPGYCKPRFTVADGGNVGIGTKNPTQILTLMQKRPRIALTDEAGDAGIIEFHEDTNQMRLQSWGDFGRTYKKTMMMLDADTGNVGIGTEETGPYKLAVEGSIGAREIVVELPGSGWPDYVFKNDYKLLSLKEVEKHITEKKHLPEIPSAKEVEQEGVPLAEMNAKLLQKIEEMTLYIIDINKRLEKVEEENKQLRNQKNN